MKIDENIANTDRELLHIFWMTWGNSMIQWKFQEKSCKKPGFHPPFRRYIFRKITTGGEGDGSEGANWPPSIPSPAVLGLRDTL